MDRRIIEAKLNQIQSRTIQSRWPVDGWESRTADHLGPGVYAYDGEWAETGVDTTSCCLQQAAAGKTLFVRSAVAAPGGVPLEELRLSFEIDQLEGLLRVDGKAYAGIDQNHTCVALPSAGPVHMEVEFICVPRSLSQPELKSERARLRSVSVVRVNPDVETLWYDLWFLWEASQFCEDERRCKLLHSALEEALLAIDLTAPVSEFERDVAMVGSRLAERVAAIGVDPEGGRVFLTGHSHIDTAWLWPLRETVRKVGRTWSTACRLMERFPDYHFSCSQPQLYVYAREHYPELYEEVRGWIKTGRWECTGGMWVESDCNVPSGESLIRQILYGVELFREEFGVRPRTCWLPDVFGYPASLPGILKGCGIDHFMTNKLHWQA
ncbi:MAG: alpha-mannosidase, partial [Anaerolineae bacterium]|nr:alpha-mannosidase [Anaerolineae bacterium]